MKYDRLKFIAGLAVLNVGAFLTTAMFLPQRGGIYRYSSKLELWFIRRHDWHIAWGVLLATLTVSIAGWLIVEAFCEKGRSGEDRPSE
ncbi:hypothetical protein STSP2_00178 [Anaerohalosphaera lusitana]|uniref:Uncharacterized protein n=1 Tax=Anaerohalosphaera lusitana TaxID=1936003 RepID=A0A1U9NGH8_9BACT|nr:hypothetical protein [Anaerohalosphaera lusitana]AQT67039.1 hypothetical protein STSP2_00178 [Anaerohalosphaera lusitana]